MSIGPNAQKALEWLGKWALRIQRAVNRTENVRGSGAAVVKSDDGGIVIHVPFAAAGGGEPQPDAWIRIETATGDESPYTYTGTFQKPDDEADDGFSDADSEEVDVRNTWERTGSNAGYVGTFTGLEKLPTGFVYRVAGYRTIADTFTVLIAERNQPKC